MFVFSKFIFLEMLRGMVHGARGGTEKVFWVDSGVLEGPIPGQVGGGLVLLLPGKRVP